MIIVKNRELLIPLPERYLGTSYDTSSEVRQFRIPRFAQNGVDLSALTFRLDIKYPNNTIEQNTVYLQKEVTDDFIILQWDVTGSVLGHPGTMFIQLRATDLEMTIKWSSFKAAMYVEWHFNTPQNYSGSSLTEVEQMEADFDHMKQVITDLEPLLEYTDDAEAWAKGTRNGNAVASSDVTYHNNSKWYATRAEHMATSAYNYMGITEAMSFGTLDGEPVGSDDPNYHNNAKYYAEQANYHSNAAMTSSGHANDYKLAAEGWAVGQNGGVDVASTDPSYHNNAKYYAEQAANSVENAAASETNAAASETNAEASASAAQASDASAATAASNSQNYSRDSEAWAVGQRNGANVGSSDSAYHNNAKYYAEQAGASSNLAGAHKDAAQLAAQQAAASATSSAVSALDASDYADQAAASATAAAASAASLTVDSALSDSSTNPVQNKVITGELTDVKSAFDQVTENARTSQLLDADNPNIVNGTVNAQRTIVSSANSIVFIPIESGKDYCVSRQQKIGRFVVYPFTNQPAVGETAGINWASSTVWGDGDYIAITKSLVSYYNANYLAVYFRNNSVDTGYSEKELLDNLKIEVGLTPTSGTNYYKKQIKTSALNIDDAIDPSSNNPVTNRAIAEAITGNASDYDVFDQMYIKGQTVVCNGDHGDTTVAKYVQTTLAGAVKKVMCRAKFSENCKNSTLQGGANVAIIIAQTDRQYPIQTITKGSIHVVFNKNYFSIGVYDENGLSDLEAANTQRYYQSGTGMTDSGMEFDGETEYEFGIEFVAADTVRVYKPNGTYLDVTDSSLATYHGNIAIWEMYIKKSTLTEWGSPEFTGFYASSETAPSMRDNFERLDGALSVAPTGHVYKCYRNSYSGDTIYDSSNATT